MKEPPEKWENNINNIKLNNKQTNKDINLLQVADTLEGKAPVKSRAYKIEFSVDLEKISRVEIGYTVGTNIIYEPIRLFAPLML